jgi:hypothetical protein
MRDHVLMKINHDIEKYLIEVDPTYESFKNEKGELVVKLLKALYGCVQSSKLWYLTLKRRFVADGFNCSSHDECVFIKHVEGILIVIAVYVDDIILQSECQDLINSVIDLLRTNFHEIKVNRGKTHQYLGMMFDYNNPGKVIIKMTGYINDLVEKFGINSTTSISNRSSASKVRRK